MLMPKKDKLLYNNYLQTLSDKFQRRLDDVIKYNK